MAVLNANVLVRNPKTGQTELLEKGTEPPKWADGLIGEHAFEGAAEVKSKSGKSKAKVKDAEAQNESTEQQ